MTIINDPVAIDLHRERPIPAAAVRSLYDTAGWWPDRTVADIQHVLDGGMAAGAWEGERLVGFARAVSDGLLRAYIEDVVVHPDYRRRGLAMRLLACLLEQLSQIETVSLFCEPELVELYARLGFRARTKQVVMHRPHPGSG